MILDSGPSIFRLNGRRKLGVNVSLLAVQYDLPDVRRLSCKCSKPIAPMNITAVKLEVFGDSSFLNGHIKPSDLRNQSLRSYKPLGKRD